MILKTNKTVFGKIILHCTSILKVYTVGLLPSRESAKCRRSAGDARLAQSVERQPFKLVVVGSSPTVGVSSLSVLQAKL